MKSRVLSTSMLGLIGILATMAASAAIFLLVRDPLVVADAVIDKDVSVLFEALMSALSQVWGQVGRYL